MSYMKKSFRFGLLIILSSTSAAARPSEIPNAELTPGEASSLVKLVVRNKIRNVHPHGNFSIEPMAVQKDKGFLAYEALGVWSEKQGSAVLGNYSVNLQTAEVWNIDSCEKIRFAQLYLV